MSKGGWGRYIPVFRAKRARLLQRKLAEKVVEEDCFEKIEEVGGLDVSYNKGVGVAVLSITDVHGVLKEQLFDVAPVPIPYVPGFLAFREVPLYIPLLKKRRPTVTLVDGHGIAHPRGLGVASHVGIVSQVPTIGVAKKRLYGEEGPCEFGKCLFDGNKPIAGILERGKKRLYVSVGHCVSLRTAVKIVKDLWKGSKLPEPIRFSDKASRELARSMNFDRTIGL